MESDRTLRPPPSVIPGGRYTPVFAVGVAVAKYTDHLPLERKVRMMAREGLHVESHIARNEGAVNRELSGTAPSPVA